MMFALLISFFVAVFFTFIFQKIAFHFRVLDFPGGRKRHTRPVALLGGVAIWLAFWGVVGGYAWEYPERIFSKISPVQLASVVVATLVIIVIGVLDERYSLSPRVRLIATALAAFIPLVGGIGLDGVTNPLGGVIPLNWPQLTIPFINTMLVLGDVLVFLWLLGMMYTTKLLDGLDGLSSGISAIGGLMIFFLTRTPRFFQPDVGLLALIFSGVCLGFLVFNFKPASIFLGESGSLFLGFMLGVLAVISGGKIATTLLVMAVPILDVARVIIIRLVRGQPISQGDREHLHFRLLDLGLSERATVLLMYALAAIFGATTLFFQSRFKVIVLVFLVVAMVGVGIHLYKHPKKA